MEYKTSDAKFATMLVLKGIKLLGAGMQDGLRVFRFEVTPFEIKKATEAYLKMKKN